MSRIPIVSSKQRPTNRPPVKIDIVKRIVASRYGITLDEMTSPCRARLYSRPRQIAMYLARQLSGRSLPFIARLFGGRDHTTVLHAYRVVFGRSMRFAMMEIELDSIEREILETAEHEIRARPIAPVSVYRSHAEAA